MSGKESSRLPRLFIELFKIALFVVGGGYAILVVADDVFGKKLKWLKEGELFENLPVFQMVPGLIAGNTAIYVGMKVAGRIGAAVGLIAVALPSLAIFLAVACGYGFIPLGNPVLESAFTGLRSSLTGIILGTVIRGWKKNVSGIYGYAAVVIAACAMVFLEANTVLVLVSAMLTGIILEFAGLGKKAGADDSAGIELAPLSAKERVVLYGCTGAVAVLATVYFGRTFWFFVKFGMICFGGGFVLVPAYMDEFVGPDAPALQLPVEEFSNLMALTQMTPGPVAVNSATFFGYRLGGVAGAAIATAGLLLPSYFLLTSALSYLDKWKSNRFIRGLLYGVKPATTALMISAFWVFCKMSVLSTSSEGGMSLNAGALVIGVLSAVALVTRKLSVMATIFVSALIGMAISL